MIVYFDRRSHNSVEKGQMLTFIAKRCDISLRLSINGVQSQKCRRAECKSMRIPESESLDPMIATKDSAIAISLNPYVTIIRGICRRLVHVSGSAHEINQIGLRQSLSSDSTRVDVN
jgi:hypothetical protein